MKRMIRVMILSFLMMSVSSISSYLTDFDRVRNTFMVGGVNIEVVEEFTPPLLLEPGTSFTKDVKVRNTGPNSCYIRIKAVFTDSTMGNNCVIDFNTEDFVYNNEDGYYYYKDVLLDGESSNSLFTTVTIKEDISQSEIKDFDIIVYSEAYQSNGFDNYKEAWEDYSKNKPNDT